MSAMPGVGYQAADEDKFNLLSDKPREEILSVLSSTAEAACLREYARTHERAARAHT